jgi:hypothetical protein
MRNKRAQKIFFLIVFGGFLFSLKGIAQDYAYLVKPNLLKAIQDEVSGERAWDMVAKISRYHRIRGGGEGSDYDRCVDWLAGEIKKLGLNDVHIAKYKADGYQKYFLWDSLVGWKVKEAELWLVEPQKKLICRYSDQAVSLMPYSQGKAIEAEVIYVGSGKTDDDYADKEVKDKIVFAVGGGGNQVHRQAVLKRSAVGIIVGPSERMDRLGFADLIEVNRLSPRGEDREKTGFGFALSRRQVKELLSYFKAGKPVKMKAVVDAALFDGAMPVLEAKIMGQDFPQQEIMVMAHLDHYKPGANDNASGSAGMFEMVQNILALIKRGDIPPLRRTIRFLWVPEMHGTIAYLNEHQNMGEQGIAGLNLDMIGEDYALCHSCFNLTCSPYSVPGYINDVMINILGWLESRAFFAPTGSQHLFHYKIRPFSGGSDHIMFNDNFFGIPTPMLGHGDVFHHTNMDTPDKCDPTEMKRIISLALAASLFLANADEKDVLHLAREAYSQACLRMAERTGKSIRLIHQYASDSQKRKKLTALFTHISRYPQIQAQVEKANLNEMKELSQKKETALFVDRLAEALDSQARIEFKNIEHIHSIFLHQYKLSSEMFVPDKLTTEASRLIPVRLFKGPLPGGMLREKMSGEFRSWYSGNLEKWGGYMGSKMYEIVNLINGKRTLLEIRDIVSCEFDETDVECVLRFARELEHLGLVVFKSPDA